MSMFRRDKRYNTYSYSLTYQVSVGDISHDRDSMSQRGTFAGIHWGSVLRPNHNMIHVRVLELQTFVTCQVPH